MANAIKSLLGIDWFHNRKVKSAYKDACERYDLIYFGAVDKQADEHEMVRGVTLSPSHRDNHYCVGSIQGWDVILLERSDTVTYPSKPSKKYHWIILQVDLKTAHLPHVLLDANHHDETFYSQLFTKFARLSRADASMFVDHDRLFSHKYTLYSPPDTLDILPLLFPIDTTSVLGHHFGHFDYECYQDRLLVYAPDKFPSQQLIDTMIKAGLWLANELEFNNHNIHHSHI